MKATVSWLGALLLAGAAVPAASAQPCPWCPNPAPDACGPGYYCQGPCGAVYGPNHCVRPCFEPFQGFLPPAQHPLGPGAGAPARRRSAASAGHARSRPWREGPGRHRCVRDL